MATDRTFYFRVDSLGREFLEKAPLPLSDPPPNIITHTIDVLELREPQVIGEPTPGRSVKLKSTNLGQSYQLCLPADEGSAGQILTTDGNDPAQLTWAGAGDVVGPAGSTDEAVARFDGVTGKLLQDSVVTIDNGGVMAGVATVNGVVPETHAVRHLPSGGDALTTAAPLLDISSSTTNDVGTADSFARSDHQHALDTTGLGDVVGPASATDTALPRYNGTTGKLIQDSGLLVDATDKLTGITGMDLIHTAAEADDHAIEIDCDAAGLGDVKALDIVYVTGNIGAGIDEEAALVNVDQSASTGGRVVAFEVVGTTTGTAEVDALECGVGCHPIHHQSGIFGDADTILNIAVDVTTELSGGVGNISAFVGDDDTMTIGDMDQFTEIEIILDTGASGSGIAPTFRFSDGIGSWATFTPADGTNGMKNNGVIIWDLTDIPSWATGTGGEYLIEITRTRNTLGTTPILDLLQISAATLYSWDKDAKVTVDTLALLESGGPSEITFTAPALVADVDYTLPADDGDANDFLQTDGGGTLSWAEPGLPPNYLDGLLVADASSSTKTVSAGCARSDDDTFDIVSGGTLTPDITSSGANGLDTGSEAGNTWYSIWVIAGGGNPVASLLSVSSSSPTLPGTYTVKRRVGWVRNDGSSNFYEYDVASTSRDRMYLWNELETVLELLTNGSATSYTNVDISELVPPSSTMAYINSNHVSNDGGQEWATFRTAGLSGTSPTTAPRAHRTFGSSANAAEAAGSTCFWIKTDATQNIEYANSTGSEQTDVWVLGYRDSI